MVKNKERLITRNDAKWRNTYRILRLMLPLLVRLCVHAMSVAIGNCLDEIWAGVVPKCKECKPGYYSQFVDSWWDKCVECPETCNPGCSPYRIDAERAKDKFDTDGLGGRCEICTNSGYTRSYNNTAMYCDKCSTAISNCDSCSTTSRGCVTCSSGYTLVSNTSCVSCSYAIPNCDSCSQTEFKCLRCASGYIRVENNLCQKCSEVIPGCLLCDTLSAKCLNCESGTTLTDDGKCEILSSGNLHFGNYWSRKRRISLIYSFYVFRNI